MKKTVLLFFVCIFAFVGCTSSDVLTWQEQYDLGIRYLNDGNYEEAIIAFTAAIEIDEKNVAAYLGRAEAYVNCNDSANALADYNAAIEIDSNCQQAYGGVANIYIGQGDYDKAAEILTYISDESVKSKLLEEIERQKTDSLELAEIQLDNVTYTFSKNDETVELNESAVGGMRITANVLSPNNAKAVLIAEWGQNISQQSQSEIKKTALRYAQMWKEEKAYVEQEREFPYEIGVSHPVYEEELGTHNEVLLIAVDENCNPVGYTVVKAEIPSKSEALLNVEVLEAASYTRETNPPGMYEPHSVSIPKISGDSVAVQNFNQKIMNRFKPDIEALKNGNLDDMVFAEQPLEGDQYWLYVSYEYTIYDGVVGILVERTIAVFNSDVSNRDYYEYYFDSVADKELNFVEYLERLNVDFDKMTYLVNEDFKNEEYSDERFLLGNMLSEHRIKKALVSENKFVAVYKYYGEAVSEFNTSVTIECPISDIKSDKAVQKNPDSDPVQILTDFYNNNKEELSVFTDEYSTNRYMVNAYLADLDNDGTPELCIKYASPDYYYIHSIYRVISGQVVRSLNNIYSYYDYWSGWKEDLRLLLDDGKIKLCGISIANLESAEFCIYDWRDNFSEYNSSEPEYIAFRSEKGVYEFSNEGHDGYPDYSEVSFDEYISKKAEYTEKLEKMMLDTDNCGFYDIWNLQK